MKYKCLFQIVVLLCIHTNGVYIVVLTLNKVYNAQISQHVAI